MSADAVPALDERIAAALTGTDALTSTEASAVLEEAEAEFRSLERQADAIDAEALSPSLTLAQAQAKRGEAGDLRFRSDRLDAACSALRIRVADLREAEECARRVAQQEAAREARDELAAEIAERYPVIVRELTGLAKRIADNNVVCEQAGIPATVEALGRGIPANFMVSGSTLATIGSISLPLPSAYGPAWGNSGGGIFGRVEYPGLMA